jgi:hypothetical protein
MGDVVPRLIEQRRTRMLSNENQALRDVSLADFAKLRELMKSVGSQLSAEDRAKVTTMIEEVGALYRNANTDNELKIAFRTFQALMEEIRAQGEE